MMTLQKISFRIAIVGAVLLVVVAAGTGVYWSSVAVSRPHVATLDSQPDATWSFLPSSSNDSSLSPVGHDDPGAITVLVNKKHPVTPITYTPPLEVLSCDGSTAYLNPQVADNFNAMCTAATAAGVPFEISSSFRSYQDQVATYNQWSLVNGGSAAADAVSARPGYSEHQTGLAMDLEAHGCALECFATTPQYSWLQEHAAEYGFIQRYYDGYTTETGYDPEPWHYRFVGIAVAEDMHARSIKTLEQYWNVSGGNYAN